MARSLKQARRARGYVASLGGGGTPPPVPTLTLSTPAPFTTSTAAGTLVSNIGNVPAGVTPTISPADGRLVIAGDQANGWTVRRGMSAVTAGTIAFTVAAAGAVNAGASVAVSAPAIAGATPTTLAIPGTVHYHPHSANNQVIGGSASFTGRVSGSTLTVTSMTSGTIAVGHILESAATPFGALRVVSMGTGTGGAGTYTVAGNPGGFPQQDAAMSSRGDRTLAAANDLRGLSDVVAGVAGGLPQYPMLLTDAQGRKFWRFTSINTYGAFLRAVAGVTNLDNANIAWMGIVRVHGHGGGGSIIVNGGNQGATPFIGMSCLGSARAPYVAGPGVIGTLVADKPAIRNKMIAHAGMQLMGASNCSQDALGGTASINIANRVYHNENVYQALKNISRSKGQTGLEIGNGALGGASYFDLYELVGWTAGELRGGQTGAAAQAATATALDAARDAMLQNWGLVPITKNVVIGGDSRFDYDYWSGDTPAMRLADALPGNYRVQTIAVAGGGSKDQWQALMNPDSIYAVPNMLGGGNDRVITHLGHNDAGGNATIWPQLASASDTVGRGNDIVDGNLQGTCTITTVAGNQTVTMSGWSGNVPIMTQAVLVSDALPVGAIVGARGTTDGQSDGTFTMLSGYAPTQTGTFPCTITWPSFKKMAAIWLGNGWTMSWYVEIRGTGGQSEGAALERIRERLRSGDFLNTISAAAGQTYAGKVTIPDGEAITQAGKFIFGADAVPVSNNTPSTASLFVDNTPHLSPLGRALLLSGADTPQLGMLAQAQAA
jgi:hypothetical protein